MRNQYKIGLCLTVLVLTVFQGQACSPMQAGKLMDNSTASLASEVPADGTTPSNGSTPSDGEIPSDGVTPGPVLPPLPVEQLASIESVRVLHRNEFLGAVDSTLESKYSPTVWSQFLAIGGNLSEDGYVDSVTAPMMNTMLTLNGSLCGEKLKVEKALAQSARAIFKTLDFAKAPSAQSATAYTDLVRNLARRSWLRNETTNERTQIIEASKIFDTANVADTELKALFICSAMLTSLDSVAK